MLISVGGGGGPVTWTSIINKPNFATVATSGSYADLTNKPTLFSGAYADLTGKPTLATVATSGSYTDLINKPTIPTDVSDLTDNSGLLGGGAELGNFTFSADDASLPVGNTMTLTTYRSGSNEESKLTLSPTSDSSLYAAGILKLGTGYGSGSEQYWQFAANGDLTLPAGGDILRSGVSVLFSGNYNDLSNKPTLFSGNYNDLTNKPTVVAIAPQWTVNHTLLPGGENTRYLVGDAVYDNGNIYVANFENESIPTSDTLYWTNIGPGKRLNLDGRDIPNITYSQLNGKPTIPDSILDLGISDGANGQVLTTDGAGNFTFTTVATGSLNARDVTRVYAYATNADSVTIQKGQPVYMFAATGNRVSVKLAANTGDPTSAKTLGLADQDIAPGNPGYICTQGVVENLNTGMYAEGDVLYLGATPGSLTKVKPHAPNHLVYIGVVERANNGNGLIYVRPQNGYELEELHNVNLIDNPPNSGDLLTYDGVQQLWVAAARDTSYAPATPSNWSAPAPTTIKEALDRLAALIKTLNSGTGA